jgi:sulfide:quinone oxidoreductase
VALRVLIAGGGVAALEAMLALRDLAEERVELELLTPGREFAYRPLAVAEPFGLGEARKFSLDAIVDACGARVHEGMLVAVEDEAHRARSADGAELGYDLLLIAAGARPRETLPGALVFRGGEDVAAFRELLAQLEQGRLERVVFALPPGVTWPVPLYELALMTAARLAAAGARAELAIATPESDPLVVFGRTASEAVARLLADRGIAVHTNAYPRAVENGELRCAPGGRIPADRVVALPELSGPRIAGCPSARNDFIPTDPHGRVEGLDDVYAAGDATTFPLKQGGIAAQQAVAAAEHIAARAGAPVEPKPFRPVLRGLLLTGAIPKFMRTELAGPDAGTEAAEQPLWWPPSKIAGSYLAPFLAAHAGLAVVAPPETLGIAVDVDVSGGLPR